MSQIARSSEMANRSMFFGIIFLFLFSGMVFAKIIVLKGTPLTIKQKTVQGLKEGPLSPEEQLRAKVVISKEGNKYLWDSHGGNEMIRQEKGGGFYFVDLTGKGFVEVVPDEKSGKYFYMENKSLDGSTYYGVADHFVKE